MPAKKSQGTKAKGRTQSKAGIERPDPPAVQANPEYLAPDIVADLADGLAGRARAAFTGDIRRVLDLAHTLRGPCDEKRVCEELSKACDRLHWGFYEEQLAWAELYAGIGPEHTAERRDAAKHYGRRVLLLLLVETARTAAESKLWRQVEQRMGPVRAWAELGDDGFKALPLPETSIDRGRFLELLAVLKHPDPAGELRRMRDKQPPETATAVHNADFTMVKWYGTEYRFALGVQADAVKALFEEHEKTGMGLHQKTICTNIDPERNSLGFRMDKAFRSHPAFGTMIQTAGDGRYRLVAPGDPPAPVDNKKQFSRIPAKARKKPG